MQRQFALAHHLVAERLELPPLHSHQIGPHFQHLGGEALGNVHATSTQRALEVRVGELVEHVFPTVAVELHIQQLFQQLQLP